MITSRRSRTVANVQDRALRLMKLVHNRRRPGPAPHVVSDPDFARLVLLDACEHLVHLTRLSRMARADEPYWRQVVVIANAVTDAIAGDVTGDPHHNTELLYRKLIHEHEEDV